MIVGVLPQLLWAVSAFCCRRQKHRHRQRIAVVVGFRGRWVMWRANKEFPGAGGGAGCSASSFALLPVINYSFLIKRADNPFFNNEAWFTARKEFLVVGFSKIVSEAILCAVLNCCSWMLWGVCHSLHSFGEIWPLSAKELIYAESERNPFPFRGCLCVRQHSLTFFLESFLK